MASLITKPSGAVSLEAALQNLASALTGKDVKEMPASLEGIVQFMAKNVTPGGGGGDAEELAGSVCEKLQADDDFISAVAAKVAAKAVPGGAPGLDGPSMASVEVSEGPSAATVFKQPTSEPAVASVPTKAVSAASNRKTSKTTE